MKNKKRTLVTLGAMIMLLSVVTYAYYTTGLSNSNAQTAELSTGTMSLSFADGDNGIGAVLNFGDTITKKFTLENTGSLDASASISWFNLVNTYLDGSLMYELEYSETLEGDYEPVVSNLMVPTSEEPITTPLVTQVTVPTGKTYYYNLNITLVNSEVIDQTSDINASFHTQFTIKDASSLSASEQTLANLGLVVSNGTPDFTKIAGTKFKDNGFSSEEKTKVDSDTCYIDHKFYYSETYTFDESTGKYTLGTLKSGNFAQITEKLKDVYINGERWNSWNSTKKTNITTIFKITSANFDENALKGGFTYLKSNSSNEFSTSELTQNLDSSSCVGIETIYYSDTYTLDENTRLYSLVNPQSGKYKDVYTSLKNVYITNTDVSWSKNTQNQPTIYKIINASYEITPNKASFTYLEPLEPAIPDYSTTGIYSMEDDYGTSYYFRGVPENNYVKFGKNSEDKDMYWRIVRVNGDGSLRIIYDGTKAYENGETSDDYSDRFITEGYYNETYYSNSNSGLGYMYGLEFGEETTAYSCIVDGEDIYDVWSGYNQTSCEYEGGEWIVKDLSQNRCLMLDEEGNVVDNISTYTTKSACEEASGKWTTNAYETTHANIKDSTIKSAIDSWYKTNIYDKGYSGAISDTLFCNDRSISSGPGIGYEYTEYKAWERLNNNHIPTPQLTCTQQNDRFTVDDTTVGNGDLTYPVGLLTADEMVLAGARYNSNNKMFYLNKGNLYWSLSPKVNDTDFPLVIGLGGAGFLVNQPVSDSNDGVAPVINLSAEYSRQLGGTGTINDPFTTQ